MAKPPGERTSLIRKAIDDHPGVGNTELANLLNEQEPGHKITANDIAKQKQLMKKLAGGGATKTRKSSRAGKKEATRPKRPAPGPAAPERAPEAGARREEALTS